MIKTVVVTICLVVLCCCVLAEGRWHGLRNPRKHRVPAEFADNMPRLLDDRATSNYDDNRHRRHRQMETMENDESTENNNEEVDKPRSPTRMEIDGDPDYQEEQEIQRVPRRRLIRSKKHHRRHHTRHHRKPTLADLDQTMDLEYNDEGLGNLSRDKRYQRQNWTKEDWDIYQNSRRVELYDHDIHVFELEVHEAQNSSLCNYTVIPIPDPGGRVPRVLEHVKCNYVGNRCRERGSYCCVQTYRNVEVTYPGNKNDTIKVYSGCVCALQIYGTLTQYTPKLPLDY